MQNQLISNHKGVLIKKTQYKSVIFSDLIFTITMGWGPMAMGVNNMPGSPPSRDFPDGAWAQIKY